MTSRGNERRPVFRDDDDRRTFLDVLLLVAERYNWLCHAYCLMSNHYHIVVETVDGELSMGMRELNGVYTQRFNRRHDRAGHLFQGRFKAMLIEKERYLLEVCRYVVLNPVRARLVRHPSDWKWSSYNSTLGHQTRHPVLTTDWVLGQFGTPVSRAREEYRQFVEAGIGHKPAWAGGELSSVLGTQDFIRRIGRRLRKQRTIPELPRRQRFIDRPDLAAVFDGTTASLSRRNEVMMVAVVKYGYRQKEIADHLGLHYSTVSRLLNSLTSKVKT